jgi:hypothetical protein
LNRKHLLYHIFEHLEACDIDISDIVESFNIHETSFSDRPQPGEITVAEALSNSYEAYKKAKKND